MGESAESAIQFNLGSYVNEVYCRLVEEKRFEDVLHLLTPTRNWGEELLGRNLGAGNINITLGQTLCKSGNHRKAVEDFTRALNIFEEIGNRERALVSRSALASEHIDTKEYEKAAQNWETVLVTLQTDYPDNMFNLAHARRNLGTALREMRRDKEGIEQFEICRKYYLDENMTDEREYCENSLKMMRIRGRDIIERE